MGEGTCRYPLPQHRDERIEEMIRQLLSAPKRAHLATRKSILNYYESESASTTEIRSLAQNLSQSQVKSLLITSANQSEGKTLIAVHLAITLAHQGNNRVLLMDFDLRRPKQHIQFCLAKHPGLSSVLRGEMPFEAAIRPTEHPNLHLMTAGRPVSSPSRLCESNLTATIIDECKFHFDTVIIDAPPVISVSDVRILSPHVDGVALVVMAGKTYRELVIRAIDLLNQSKANLLGLILNDIDGALPYYYHDRKYYHYRQGR